MNAKPAMTLNDLIGAYIAEQCSVIIDAEDPLRNGENVVHTTRVAVRRLRSTIRVFADLLDVPLAAGLEDELVWWAGLLGEVRDLDILTARLLDLIDQLPPELVMGPVASTIQAELGALRKEAADVVVAELDGERYRQLVETVRRWQHDVPFVDEAPVAATKINRYLKRADKKVARRLAVAVSAAKAGDPAAEDLFHRARKSGKRHRYAVEAAAPFLGDTADKIISRRKDLQDLLGDHQDSRVSATFLRDLGARLGVRGGHNGFTYGVLYSQERSSTARLLKDLKPFL
jgi:CHAD domain-containing protein